MKFSRLLIPTILVLALCHTAQAQDPKLLDEATIAQPPVRYSFETIQNWVQEAVTRIRPEMQPRLMKTADWANYINFEHFVPLDSDPHVFMKTDADLAAEMRRADDTLEVLPSVKVHYDYNWNANDAVMRGLATAEVTETGEFLFWWNRCNFKNHDEALCKRLINVIVAHEAHHFDQWRFIAMQVLAEKRAVLRNTDETVKKPTTLRDLEAVPGAKEAFLKIWSDPAHYQCREVEVYTKQMISGEMPQAFFSERVPYLKWYTRHCNHSAWKQEFGQHIHRAQDLVKWWRQNPEPAAEKK